MDLTTTFTVILFAVSSLLTVFFGFMGARPMDPRKGPRMVPWRFLMLLSFTAALLLLTLPPCACLRALRTLSARSPWRS